jgi:hypothetical protein
LSSNPDTTQGKKKVKNEHFRTLGKDLSFIPVRRKKESFSLRLQRRKRLQGRDKDLLGWRE